MTSRILDEEGDIAAEPAFRIGAVFAPETLWRPGLQVFLANLAQDVLPGVKAVFGRPLVSRYGYYDFKPAQWTKALKVWKDKPTKYRESEAVMTGEMEGYNHALPYIGIYEGIDAVLIDLSVAASSPLDPLLTRLWEPLLSENPVFAIAGFGIAPDLHDSVTSRHISAAKAKRRYRMAWCMRLDTVDGTLIPRQVERFNELNRAQARPGIPDIGWKTVIGGDLAARANQSALGEIEGVTLRPRGGGIEITIGDAPRWGDVDTGENIAAYAAVCRALAPIQASKAMLHRTGLGNQDGLAEFIDDYYRLWEPA
jgi:hypothetical protein